MHKQPVYCKMNGNEPLLTERMENGVIRQTSSVSVAYVNGVSEDLFRRGLCLPSGPMVTTDDFKRIVEVMKGAIV